MPPSYIRVRAVVWAYGRGQTDRQTDRQTHRRAWPQYILRRLRLTQNVITRYKVRIAAAAAAAGAAVQQLRGE